MTNKDGVNGIDNGTKPPDNLLRPALHQFSRRQMSVPQRLAELNRRFGYSIGKNTLIKLNKQFEVPSVRKPPSLPVITSLVAQAVDEDVLGRHGPTTIQRMIAREQNVIIPRDILRVVHRGIDPEGPARRFPGRKRTVKVRGQLKALGVMEEVHCDGHEKLGAKALKMGQVGIPIYGFRDHTGMFQYLTVVPNDRDEMTIGHTYLDFVEERGEIPIQLTFDCGTETGMMRRLQGMLRSAGFVLERPSTVALGSTDNIPIESGWSYWQDYAGRNIKAVILDGHSKGYFASADPDHVNLFQWLWPQIVQTHLDLFKDFWNTTPRRKQDNKLLPTAAPDMVYNYPEDHNLIHCGIPVPKPLIQELRNSHLATSREDAMRWVPHEFDILAKVVYQEIGSPRLHYSTGWETYKEMLDVIQGA
ncbi:hypothetical protein GGX14DRAFT_374113 [Mycena pura]|uniref:Uncharacterized protein n=1 Tax=Mycena pura TaxID=153505 RepID=A0AAD6UYX9_9AGAR|nr:hypothetical protein GGX14DRAFT_374113 [Mycena pura]